MLLPSTMEDINNSYNVGRLSFDNVEELYIIVDSYEVIEVSECQNKFKELASSKQSYDDAVLAMKNSDYSTAISHYKNVISADSLYNTAQQELQSTTDKYKNNITNRFYEFVLNGNMDDATKIIDEAVTVVSDDSFNKMKANLTSGIYDKVFALLNKSSEWEIITQTHAGENTHCCYEIKLSKNNSNAFECYYVTKSLNSLVQSGNVSSIGGPVAWYRLSGNTISELTYDEEKRIESGGYSGSVSWDYTMPKTEKFETLEILLS